MIAPAVVLGVSYREFLLRLCALVPPPNAIAPTSPTAAPATPHPDAPDDPTRARRLDWATLLKRSFGIDALACPRCGHRMQLLAVLEDPRVAEKILTHLGLPIRAPPAPPPFAPIPSLFDDRGDRDDRGGYDGIDAPSRFE